MVWSLIRMEVLRFEPSRVGYRVGGKTIELWSLDMQERGARAFKNTCGAHVTRKRRLQPLPPLVRGLQGRWDRDDGGKAVLVLSTIEATAVGAAAHGP